MVTRVFVLGRVEIESEGGLITEPRFPGRQGRRLFAYLVCNRQQPVTPEELAEALWHETLPPAWGSALHALISNLRAHGVLFYRDSAATTQTKPREQTKPARQTRGR